MFDLRGKRALITGGTRGLGKATAVMLARNGVSVAMNYRRDDDSARATLNEVSALAPGATVHKADLEDDVQVRAMVREAASAMGGIDIFIANAAATAFKPILETKPHNIARTFNLSVGGFVAAVQEVAKVMPDGGRIVMVSGIDSIRDCPGHGVLGAAKAALESMMRAFAFELGPRQITVNGVNFAYVETDSSRFYFGADFEAKTARIRARSAMRRVATPDEVAAIICMLCMPEASYFTAQTILVDGGIASISPFEP